MSIWTGRRCGCAAQVETAPPPRFDVGDGAMCTFFREEGYCVVRGAADVAETGRVTDLLWGFLEAATPMERADATTWGFPDALGYADLGILNTLGFNHSRCCWAVRQLPGVQDAFRQIWFDDPGLESAEQLIVSFDGGNVFLPWHGGRAALVPDARAHKTSEGWFHVDQGRTKGSDRRGVQGLLALTAATRATGGLLVVPGSHKRHRALMERQRHDGDFVCIDDGDPIDVSASRLVVCEAGDLILWDSRVVHCNTCALEAPDAAAHPLDELLRAAVYCSMCPASFCPPEMEAFRRRAFFRGQGTNHWAHDPSPVGSAAPLAGAAAKRAAAASGKGGKKKKTTKGKGDEAVSDEMLAVAAEERGVALENLGLVTGRAAPPPAAAALAAGAT